MKRALILAAFASAAMMTAAQAQTFATANTDVNIRSGPDPMFPVVGMIRESQRASVIGCIEGSRWCQVDFRGRVGWAYSQYMSLSGQMAAILPVPEIEVPAATTVVTAPRAVVTAPVATYAPPVTYTAPAVTYAQPAPVVTYAQPAPVATYQAPVVTYRAPATTVVETTAAAPRDYSGTLIAPRERIYASTNLPRALTPPADVRGYVTTNALDSAYLEGNVVVGAGIPDDIELNAVPNYRYRYTYVNDYPVLVDPVSRRIVYVYR